MNNDVEQYYDSHIFFEDQRLKNNPFEIPITLKYIEKYLKTGDKILDIACGTGTYAEILLKKGFQLGLNDLSENNIKLTHEKVKNHQNILYSSVSNALDAGIWKKELWDAVLILGPLYHLTKKDNRIKILKNAKKYVKRGGYIFSAFMSRTAAMLYGLKNNPEGIQEKQGVFSLWETGTDKNFVEGTEWFTNAYFSFSEEINPFIEEAGLKPLHLIGIEGLFGENMNLYNNLKPNLKKQWFNFIMDHCEDKHLLNYSKHYLSVSQNI
ncbi:MAG: methyltransferase domain-containing protein [Bacteroidetes bacterium]|nr:methyltransferase domain-containing protein [Bacteroidota bacterium]